MPNDSNQQAISDDQELAKVLAGVSQDNEEAPAEDTAPVAPPSIPGAVLPSANDNSATDTAAPDMSSQMPVPSPAPEPKPATEPETPSMPTPSLGDSSNVSAPSGELDTIKQQALGELRPLVDKLDVSPEEKFDTYLLLLRSTDDKDLISPAHDAAKAITDETRRAQALLDIIKEIDFLSQNQK